MQPTGPSGTTPERVPRIPGDETNDRTTIPTIGGQTAMSENRWNPADFNQDRSQFREQTVYFDFDKSTIKSSEQSKIQAVASFLKSEQRMMIEIEGHCDERGTAEYNRSLGERRALAVREYLISLGVAGERATTISFGEDRPADPGHGEAAWAKNRRGEFVLLRPKN